MKFKKSKKLYVLFILFELFLVPTSLCIAVVAYNNGSGRIGATTGSKFTGTQNPYNSNFNYAYWEAMCYATHDWIADAALERILTDATAIEKWQSEECQNFWTFKRKICYLIGTEAPDASANRLNIVLNGRRVTGLRTQTKMWFYPVETDEYGNNVGNSMRFKKMYRFYYLAIDWINLVKVYLGAGKTDLAAFYMGAISHVIADMACFPHVVDTGDAPDYKPHANFEHAIETCTDTPLEEDKFYYPTNYPILSIDPGFGILRVAFETRWDYTINMLELWAEPYPSSVEPGTNKADVLKDYFIALPDAEQRNVKYWVFWFKNAIQHHLDMAVKYTTYALNYFADYWNGESETDCDECDDNGGGGDFPFPDGGSGQGILTSIRNALSIISVVGLTSSLGIPIIYIVMRASQHLIA